MFADTGLFDSLMPDEPGAALLLGLIIGVVIVVALLKLLKRV